MHPNVYINTDWKLYLAQTANPLLLRDERIAIIRVLATALATPLNNLISYLYKVELLGLQNRTIDTAVGFIASLTGISPVNLRYLFNSQTFTPDFFYAPEAADVAERISRLLTFLSFHGITPNLQEETSNQVED